jgi:hypothetical protein
MTIGMLLLGIICCTCGFVLADLLGKLLGFPGYITGFITGIGTAYFIFWAVLVGRLQIFFPLPLCRHGKCEGYNDYYWKTGTICGWEWWGIYRYRCKCANDEYIRKGRQFMLVLPDGATVPFRKLYGFRKWKEDK